MKPNLAKMPTIDTWKIKVTKHSSSQPWASGPTYDGAELRDTGMRPGAYDYRKHPSRIGAVMTWYGPGGKPIRTETQSRP